MHKPDATLTSTPQSKMIDTYFSNKTLLSVFPWITANKRYGLTEDAKQAMAINLANYNHDEIEARVFLSFYVVASNFPKELLTGDCMSKISKFAIKDTVAAEYVLKQINTLLSIDYSLKDFFVSETEKTETNNAKILNLINVYHLAYKLLVESLGNMTKNNLLNYKLFQYEHTLTEDDKNQFHLTGINSLDVIKTIEKYDILDVKKAYTNFSLYPVNTLNEIINKNENKKDPLNEEDLARMKLILNTDKIKLESISDLQSILEKYHKIDDLDPAILKDSSELINLKIGMGFQMLQLLVAVLIRSEKFNTNHSDAISLDSTTSFTLFSAKNIPDNNLTISINKIINTFTDRMKELKQQDIVASSYEKYKAIFLTRMNIDKNDNVLNSDMERMEKLFDKPTSLRLTK